MTNFIDEMLAEVEEKELKQKLEFNLLQSDQALVAVATIEAQMKRANDLADEEIRLAEHFRKSEVERLDKKRAWILMNIEGFLRRHNQETGEKTVRMVHGQISLRKSRDRIEITKPDIFEKVADRLGLWRVTPEKKEPDLQAVSAAIKVQKSIPGVTVIPGAVNFHYSINGGGNGKEESAEAE